MSTFVSIGNAKQPFIRMLDAVANIAGALPQPVVIQYGHNEFICDGCELHDFIAMTEFEDRVSRAELVIIHAGAGSIIHAIRCGKVPVVVPRRSAYSEHVDDHQIELAMHFQETGKVIVVTEMDQLAGAVQQALDRQRNSPQSMEGCNAAIALVKAAIDSAMVD